MVLLRHGCIGPIGVDVDGSNIRMVVQLRAEGKRLCVSTLLALVRARKVEERLRLGVPDIATTCDNGAWVRELGACPGCSFVMTASAEACRW